MGSKYAEFNVDSKKAEEGLEIPSRFRDILPKMRHSSFGFNSGHYAERVKQIVKIIQIQF